MTQPDTSFGQIVILIWAATDGPQKSGRLHVCHWCAIFAAAFLWSCFINERADHACNTANHTLRPSFLASVVLMLIFRGALEQTQRSTCSMHEGASVAALNGALSALAGCHDQNSVSRASKATRDEKAVCEQCSFNCHLDLHEGLDRLSWLSSI